MGKRALVILGAGASYDLVPIIDGQRFGPTDDRFRPPLTKYLFLENELTSETLEKYPSASNLAGSIRYDLQKGEDLESVLLRLRRAEDLPRAQQFPQVPLFLQDMFGRISERYTSQPVNYSRLADMLFKTDSGFESIAFVTLNYETLLEKVLAPDYLGNLIRNLDSYITQKCLLVKLHGSADWAWRLDLEQQDTTPSGAPFRLQEYLELLQRLKNDGLKKASTDDISLRPPADLWRPNQDNAQPVEVYYPALSVPLGEYEPVCPRNHIAALKEFLNGCRNVLAIGVSGKDADLLELLKENLPQEVHSFWLIDKGEENATRAYQNFLEHCPQLKAKFPYEPRVDGFTGFIQSDDLDRFIAGSR